MRAFSIGHTRLIIRWFAIALAALCIVPAWGRMVIHTAAQEATEPKFVPIAQKGHSSVGGLCIDIMRAIERIEPDLQFVGEDDWQPLARVEAGVAAGTLDAACGFLRNAQREAKFTYIDPPLFPVNYHLAVRINDDVQVNNWDDIRKLGDDGVLLVINGFGMIKKLEGIGGLRIDSGAKDSKINLDKLLAGRGRFYLHRAPGMKREISNAGAWDKVKLLPVVIHTETFHMAPSKNLPPDIVARVQKAIIRLERNGELAKLREKWDEERWAEY